MARNVESDALPSAWKISLPVGCHLDTEENSHAHLIEGAVKDQVKAPTACDGLPVPAAGALGEPAHCMQHGRLHAEVTAFPLPC